MEAVVADLVAAMEAGAGDWSMPWRAMAATGWPTNATTANRYHGGNALWFSLVAHTEGYSSHRWATYKQWASVGAQVRKGEHGTAGIYWNVTPAETVTETDATTGDDVTLTSGERVGWARAFTVFNADQVDGDPHPSTRPGPVTPMERLAHCEAFFDPIPAEIEWGTGNPAYSPRRDVVIMPAFDAFTSAEHVYGTLAHELAHWTGHPDRLARAFGARFADHAYAAEELVAELSAAFTCALVGIEAATRTDHAAYLAHWCQLLTEKPATLWTVAAKAQAATDHLAAYHTPNTLGGAA
ncbi:zincin-like metallopeptidase domain-containing protein [soil metagenome]